MNLRILIVAKESVQMAFIHSNVNVIITAMYSNRATAALTSMNVKLKFVAIQILEHVSIKMERFLVHASKVLLIEME